MSLATSIRSSTQWLLAGSLGGSMFHFLFGIVLARLLVPEDFGLLVTVQIFTGVAGLIASGGMGQALIRSKDASEHDFNVVFTLQLGICILIYGFFYTVAPFFARWYQEPIYETLLRVTALNFLLRPLVGNHNVWLHREMRFKARSIIGLVTGIVVSLSSIFMAWMGMGVWSLAFSGILGSLVNWTLLSRQTPLRPRLALDRAAIRRVSGTGIKFTLLDIVSYLRGQANNFVIGRLAGPAAVGLFNKAESLAKLPFSTVSSAVYQPLFRAMAAEQDNIDKSKYLYFRAVTLLLAYTLPAYVAFSWLAEPFITFIYGPKWIEAAAPLSILAWVWVFSCIGHPAGALLAAQNRLGQELIVQSVSLILNTIACLIGMRWGLAGVAWGLLITRVYAFTHMMWLVNLCFPIRWVDFASAIRPGLVLGTVTLLTLFLVSTAFPVSFQVQHQGLFLAASLLASGFAYASTFLFLPMATIANESDRWRRMLRIGVGQ
jgi:O-antigen/teichoic acid export membrane protein